MNVNENEIIYIYFPCIREIWRFVHQRKTRGKYDYFEVENFSYLPHAREMNVLFHQANVLVNSAKWNLLAIFCLQNYYFGNICGVIFTNMEYRYITKALNLENFEKGKYDIVEREIRCFDKCHVGLFRPIKFLYK